MKNNTLTTVEVCKKIGIPRSTLYYLRDSGGVSFPDKYANQYLNQLVSNIYLSYKH